MEYLKTIGTVLSGAGLMKLTELLMHFRMEKRLKTAQARNLAAQTEGQLIKNWLQWVNTLEAKIKDLEEKVARLQRENSNLKQRLSAYINQQPNDENC